MAGLGVPVEVLAQDGEALAEDLVQTALIRSWPRWERITRRDVSEIYVLRVTPKRYEQSGAAE
jgi:lambda repressor-like predicted transcriptional regulator